MTDWKNGYPHALAAEEEQAWSTGMGSAMLRDSHPMSSKAERCYQGDLSQASCGFSALGGLASSESTSSELGLSDLTAVRELRRALADAESSGTRAEFDFDELEQADSATYNFFLSVVHAQPFTPHHVQKLQAASSYAQHWGAMPEYAATWQGPVGLQRPVDKTKIEELTPAQIKAEKRMEDKMRNKKEKFARQLAVQQRIKALVNVPTALDHKIVKQFRIIMSEGACSCDELEKALEWGRRCLSISTFGKPFGSYLAERPQFYQVLDCTSHTEVRLAARWDE